jgi:ABC-type sugar transport system ATPase subunit
MELMLERIEKQVGAQTHLYPMDLTLVPRAVTVLLGATQAGKTSLMRVMAGLDAPSKGRVLADGQDVTGKPVRERNVSMVYQQFINYPHLTVYENIASPLRVIGVDDAKIKERVGKVAELLRLAPMLQRKPAELSGGQQQRFGGLGGGVDHGRVAGGEELRQLLAQLFAQLVVEVHQRLVQKHQRRLLGECARERHALLLPARQLRRQALQEGLDVQLGREVGHARSDALLAAQLQRRRDVVRHRH